MLAHDLDVLLRLLYHLDCLVPFLLELLLRLAYLFLLQAHPTLQLVLPLCVGTRAQLLLLEHFLDVPPFFILSVVQCFLSHLDQVHKLVVFDDAFKPVCCKLLK